MRSGDVRDEMERKLRFLNTELEKAEIDIRKAAPVEAPDPQSEYSEPSLI